MVQKLFGDAPPHRRSRVLDPGTGEGEFIDGLLRWCRRNGAPVPQIVGVESDPAHVAKAIDRFRHVNEVEVRHADFLSLSSEPFDYIVGNPPYVPITALTETERAEYRRRYRTATGRFDLYLLFFEQALSQLTEGGRLVFITPEKFLYVDTAKPLRRVLGHRAVEELHFLDEGTFAELVTYPLVTVVSNSASAASTRVIRRDGKVSTIRRPTDGRSWLGAINGHVTGSNGPTLLDVAQRISCGVATGADGVFVVRRDQMDSSLARFARPTISGREITGPGEPTFASSMLMPYLPSGELMPEADLAQLGEYLSEPTRRLALLRRTCVLHKPWYAFHETPPLVEMLRPKVLCKDITREPFFIVDRLGTIVPRHSVYYVVPRDSAMIDELADYLNSDSALAWLRAHCQRAANGFFRLQSAVLKRLPVPEDLLPLDSPRQTESQLQPA